MDGPNLKVKIELHGVGHRLIHYKSSGTVPTLLVALGRVLREEPDVVTLAYDYDRDFRVDVQFLTSSCRGWRMMLV